MRSKLKLAFIANKTKRKLSFQKRKSGIMKKLFELTTLCDVKACAIISSPYEVPHAWPSREGVEEVVSKFMVLPETKGLNKGMDHETYLRDKITKAEGQLTTLCNKNRESQLRQLMFDYLEDKPIHHPYDARDLQDLSVHIDDYINQLHGRLKFLTENGESSSLPPLQAVVAGPNPPSAAAPIDLNQPEPVQCQTPIDLNNPVENLSLDSNDQYPYQHTPFRDGNDYHQLPNTDLAIGLHMPSITTTTTTAPSGVHAP